MLHRGEELSERGGAETRMMSFVASLDSISASDLREAGARAYSLRVLSENGIRIPKTLCVAPAHTPPMSGRPV
jgi:hypothetical protein